MLKLGFALVLLALFDGNKKVCKAEYSARCMSNGAPHTGGWFENPSSCRHYFQCLNGHLYSKKCGPGKAFTKTGQGRCVAIASIPECARMPTYPPPAPGAEESLYADPPSWGVKYPSCTGRMQSPINIVSKARVNNQLGRFDRSIFSHVPSSMTIKNNGHSIQVDLENGYVINNPSLLPGAFKAVQFHFHWGGPGKKGSEHTVDGVRSFGEMHIVHYDTKYKNAAEASLKRRGLAVLAFFLKDNNPKTNSGFDRVLSPIRSHKVQYHGDHFTFQHPFPVGALLPHGKGRYYRYEGSLTTPGCFETVVWTVFQDPIRISHKQAGVLRNMVYENTHSEPGAKKVHIYNNYRQVQRLFGRVVRKSPAFQ